MRSSPLRGLSRVLEGQAPSESHSLVHVRPREAQLLEEITGKSDRMPGTGIRKFAGGGPALSQLSAAVSQGGRGGDTELAYVRPEHMEILRKLGDGTVNPATGLQEYGLFSAIKSVIKGVGKAVKSVVKSPIGQVLLPVALSVIAPGIGTALGMSAGMAGSAAWSGLVTGIGMTGANKIAGASWGDALKGGLFSGLAAGAAKGVMTGNWMGGASAPPAAPTPFTPSPDLAAAGLPQGGGLPASIAAQGGSGVGASPGFYSGLSAGQAPLQSLAQTAPATFAAPAAAGAATAGAAGAGAAKSGSWLTNPLFFKETPGVMGKLGRAVTTPLGIGAAALALSGNRKRPDYSSYLSGLQADQDEMNESYMQALAPQSPLRVALSPQVGPRYGMGPEQLFWGNVPAAKRGGRVRYAEGGAAEFSGPVKGPGGGQDDKVYLPNARLADGEFVMDATTTADLGDGSTEEGFRKWEEIRSYIKDRKGRKHGGPIPKSMGGLKALKDIIG